MSVNFENATLKLEPINTQLKQFGLSLTLDYKDNITKKSIKVYSYSGKTNKLILCLMKKSGNDTDCNDDTPNANLQCVASIDLNIYEDVEKLDKNIVCEITSFTKTSCENRSYNTFLRSVLIFIANMITLNKKNITIILSIPLNNISRWLLVSSYYTINKYGAKNMKDGGYIEAYVTYSPDDFKGIKSSNIFNNAKGKKISTHKSNKVNAIPHKLNNKNSKKKIRNIINDINKKLNNRAKLSNIQKKKTIVESITEIEIDIDPKNENGTKNIVIAEEKINKFISSQSH